jgi:hypothetical protein
MKSSLLLGISQTRYADGVKKRQRTHLLGRDAEGGIRTHECLRNRMSQTTVLKSCAFDLAWLPPPVS